MQKGFVPKPSREKHWTARWKSQGGFASHTPQSVRYIKRLIRNAVETPLDQGLRLERNLYMDLCGGTRRLRGCGSYENRRVTDPAQGLRLEHQANRLFSIVDRDVSGAQTLLATATDVVE
jgi:hypothetical protein